MNKKRMEALKRAMVIRFGGFAAISAALLYFFGRNYWQGWLYWAVLFAPMSLVVLYFLNRDPEFLERRTRYKEKEREQAAIIIISGLSGEQLCLADNCCRKESESDLQRAYAIICHPMYLGYLMMMLAMPVALGSWAGVVIFSLYIPLIIARILNEEKVLARDLPGYADYRRRTRYRLLPGIW